MELSIETPARENIVQSIEQATALTEFEPGGVSGDDINFADCGRRQYKLFGMIAAAACVLTLAGAAAAQGGQSALTATLSGATEVPGPADSEGSGSARIIFAEGPENLCFEIVVRDIAPATMAHIHGGPAGAAGGPPVVRLAAPTSGQSQGCVAAPQPLVDAIRADPSAYFVNIHNAEFPGGAIRGQLSG
jgi:hypothetical protein